MKQSLLITFNGSSQGLPAVQYGAWLAETLHLPVTLLGIVEHPPFAASIEEVFQGIKPRLEEAGLETELILQKGDPVEILCNTADARKHLVVIGPLGRPGWQRIVRGASFRYILQDIQTPMIYTTTFRTQLKNILLCLGGLGYTQSLEHWVNYLARKSHAHLNILHIVQPMSYQYPIASQIKAHWEEVVKTDTPQGRNLRQALQTAIENGIETRVKIRHGDIIHEITAELRENAYDLAAMGSAGSTHSLRHLYLPNVTAEIAEKSAIPILTARLGQEPIFPVSETP